MIMAYLDFIWRFPRKDFWKLNIKIILIINYKSIIIIIINLKIMNNFIFKTNNNIILSIATQYAMISKLTKNMSRKIR